MVKDGNWPKNNMCKLHIMFSDVGVAGAADTIGDANRCSREDLDSETTLLPLRHEGAQDIPVHALPQQWHLQWHLCRSLSSFDTDVLAIQQDAPIRPMAQGIEDPKAWLRQPAAPLATMGTASKPKKTAIGSSLPVAVGTTASSMHTSQHTPTLQESPLLGRDRLLEWLPPKAVCARNRPMFCW